MFQCLAIGIGVGLVILVVICPIKIKRMLVTVFSSYSYRPARTDEFPRLDLLELERLTAQWEALGFVQCGDSEGSSVNPKLGTWFSRLFEHESEGATVDLMQQFTASKALPINSSIVSLWGQREGTPGEGLKLMRMAAAIPPLASPTPLSEEPASEELNVWMLVTSNRAPNRYFRVTRHPRVLGARLEPDIPPAQMWQFHQQRASLIEARLGTTALRGDLPQLLRAHGRVLNDILVRRLRKTPAWKLAVYSLNRKPSPPTYDGDLAPLSG